MIIYCLYVYLLDFLCATHDLLFLVNRNEEGMGQQGQQLLT
jgi:hypothetical protein